jgi:threonine/homoserine/homoserine lactone efflux protein
MPIWRMVTISTSTGANVGVLRGLPCLCGVTIGMGLMMGLVAFGLGSLVLEHPMILHGLKWGGMGFLLWLSWKMVTTEHRDTTTDKACVGFWGAVAFQWINSKSWLVSASAVGTYLPADAGSVVVPALAFGLLFVLAAFPSGFVWLAFGATIQRLLATERAVRRLNAAMGAMLAASVLLFLW